MRLSCNGCRVLRRGCTNDCPIRPCLDWIKSPDSQANATLFLAKFYGRAGLLNLLTAAPPQPRPSIFKSLLYEACGRIVNPIFGSTGLLSTGRWHLCEAAVEDVLIGAPIQQAPSESSFDIRHVSKIGKSCCSDRARKPKQKVEPVVSELMVTRSGSKLEGSVSRDSRRFGESEHINEADSNLVESVEPARADIEELELELTLGLGPMN
ncbi:LOB domain-containing protein 41-like [Gastrolobium bilobum]|uniref:LOB domain-containing protein 41-like n=1 Tax=Gastrolobium bilobum TaxID=150636 RepID=UPI002AB1FF75|nr:LOB domain-containing protein 41-like [Gastrolobium bilobum]